MPRIDVWFLLLAALCLIGGMALGIVMGVSHDHTLAPVHVHLNLLGWTTLGLFGLAYRGWPELARSPLAAVHLVLSGGGAILMPAGIWLALTGGAITLAVVGSLLAFAGAVVFLLAVVGLLARPAAALAAR